MGAASGAGGGAGGVPGAGAPLKNPLKAGTASSAGPGEGEAKFSLLMMSRLKMQSKNIKDKAAGSE